MYMCLRLSCVWNVNAVFVRLVFGMLVQSTSVLCLECKCSLSLSCVWNVSAVNVRLVFGMLVQSKSVLCLEC